MSPRRCPLCRKINDAHALACDCGYRFGQSLGDARAMVRRQLGSGVLAIGGGVTLTALGIGLALLSLAGGHFLALGTIIAGCAAIGRGTSMVVRSRRSLRELPTVAVARALERR